MYAGDTVILQSRKEAKELELMMNDYLKLLKNCSDLNCLSLNINKMKYIVFMQKNKMDINLNTTGEKLKHTQTAL